MEKLLLSEIGSALDRRINCDTVITGICTDTRKITAGCLFIALKGENFDAHDFVPQAFECGAAACVTEREVVGFDCIVVESCRKALLDIAHYYRRKFNPFVVGVTGSVGKTTTKEFIYLVLSQKFKTLKTEGNFNNEIGLPWTLFNLTSEHEAAVIEMGMSNFGEISRLSQTAQPHIGVITNIGFSHIENLGSQVGILKAKLEIRDGVPTGVPLILNGDDPLLYKSADIYDMTFGIENPHLDCRASDITECDGMTSFTAMYYNVKEMRREYLDITLPCIGRHNVLNALAAICVGRKAGVPCDMITEAFKKYVPDSLRQNISEKNGQTVITDCYNASPDSMRAALNVLSLIECKGKRIAVLGDMLELGKMSAELHELVGKTVASVKLDMLFCYGEQSEYIHKTAQSLGVKSFWSADKNEIAERLVQSAAVGDTVLFKASRGMRLEEIIQKVYEN